mgnify:CR=1 FL=1
MNKYLLLLHEDPTSYADFSPDDMQAIVEKYSAWNQQMAEAGKLLRGQKLEDGTGRVLRAGKGKPTITDGPYSESKEVIGGLFEIQAESYEEAVEIASSCPHLENGIVEIRLIEID